jgi:hypothetical protein
MPTNIAKTMFVYDTAPTIPALVSPYALVIKN